MKNELETLREEIEAIKDRNRRVEADKAWELSGTRKIVIALATYLVVLIFMLTTGFDRPFLGALVPTAGYLLSMSSMSFIKKRWIKKHAR